MVYSSIMRAVKPPGRSTGWPGRLLVLAYCFITASVSYNRTLCQVLALFYVKAMVAARLF